MTTVMSYKGYQARIEYDDADAILVGHIAGISDIVGFHADNVQDLRKAFEEAIDDYLTTCETIGKKPQKAFSGNLMLRISPELHANVALAAQISGVSINLLAEAALRAVSEQDVDPNRIRGSTVKAPPKRARRKAPTSVVA